jgi:hypothetical protein
MNKLIFKLTGDQYEIIKRDFKELREKYKLINKGKFPVFKWVGNGEFIEGKYVREYDPLIEKETLKAVTIVWIGNDITHFLVDFKNLLKTVR